MEVRGQFVESGLSFYHMGSGDHSQVSRLGGSVFFSNKKNSNVFCGLFGICVWVSVWACVFISQGIELLSNQSDRLLRAKDIRIERRYIFLIFF